MKSSLVFSILVALVGLLSIRNIEGGGYTCGEDKGHVACPYHDGTKCIDFCSTLGRPCPQYSFRTHCKKDHTDSQCWDWCLTMLYVDSNDLSSS